MADTVAETIKSITRKHLEEDNGLLFGQCVTAVGWIGGTVPEMTEDEGIVELSMADVSGAGIVVGVAVVGRKPIYVIRYQGFMWYNSAPLLNYAAKSKDMWNVPCPIFCKINRHGRRNWSCCLGESSWYGDAHAGYASLCSNDPQRMEGSMGLVHVS